MIKVKSFEFLPGTYKSWGNRDKIVSDFTKKHDVINIMQSSMKGALIITVVYKCT